MPTEAQKRQQIAELFKAHEADSHPALRALDKRWNFVPGMGSVNPRMVLVGEAPGGRENDQRRPFCGPAGTVLDDLLESVEMRRDDVWITNCVKWRPDEHNRDPSAEERGACRPYLLRELAILGCPYLVALGRQPLTALVPQSAPRQRAEWAPIYLGRQPYWLLPLYHPAVAVYARSKKPLLMKEFRQVLERP